ncbi:MAG: short chain dehydrogenase [Draconibacterium sp.]
MKILVIGGNSGTIGKSVATRLSQKHEVITTGRSSGDIRIDINDPEAILQMYRSTSGIDAVVCCSGATKWAPFAAMSEDDIYVGIKSKLMGQVNLVRIGKDFVNEGASFTLTSGILADDPVYMSSNAAMVNGALHSFVKAVAPELKKGLRLNVVAPGLVENSAERLGDAFPGHTPVAMDKVASGYVRSVEGMFTGEVIRVF